jgi:hypothetical protein
MARLHRAGQHDSAVVSRVAAPHKLSTSLLPTRDPARFQFIRKIPAKSSTGAALDPFPTEITDDLETAIEQFPKIAARLGTTV